MSILYPLINQPGVLRLLNSRIGRRSLKGVFRGFNFLFGRWGNCFIVVGWKR
jgi:hypothetical protein